MKAREWNIAVLNHSWLIDCFLQWTNVTPTNQRYITWHNQINQEALLGDQKLTDSHLSPWVVKATAEDSQYSKEHEATCEALPDDRTIQDTADQRAIVSLLSEGDSTHPSGHRRTTDGPEIRTPLHNGRKRTDSVSTVDTQRSSTRKAAIRASEVLHDAGQDLARHQADLKRERSIKRRKTTTDSPREDFDRTNRLPAKTQTSQNHGNTKFALA